MNVVDMFAGPGGWDVAAQQLGLDPLGIEWDDAACATRKAAGLRTRQADVSQMHPQDFAPVDLLIASPPCQDFSMAGKRAGIDGDRGKLVHEVIRWADALRPEFIACEQVPPVLDIWRGFAYVFRTWGYSTWCGILNAANYGVPQTRQRAILLACKSGQVRVPEPTHCRGGAEPSMFSDGLLPWVSMAEALGWDEGAALRHPRGTGMVERHGPRADKPAELESMTVTSKARSWVRTNNTTGTGYDGTERVNYERPGEEPSPTLGTRTDLWTLHTNRGQEPDGTRQTVTTDNPAPSLTGKSGGQWQLRSGNQANACLRAPEEPSPTIAFGHNSGGVEWVNERPATTVQGDPRIGRPGHKGRESGGESQFAVDSVRITVEEAAALQSFPPDYPWQGSRTAQFTQIGNAIPPRLALHILSAVTGIAVSERAA